MFFFFSWQEVSDEESQRIAQVTALLFDSGWEDPDSGVGRGAAEGVPHHEASTVPERGVAGGGGGGGERGQKLQQYMGVTGCDEEGVRLCLCVCVCLCMRCVCAHIYGRGCNTRRSYTYIYIHLDIYTYVHIYIYICVCIFVYIYMAKAAAVYGSHGL